MSLNEPFSFHRKGMETLWLKRPWQYTEVNAMLMKPVWDYGGGQLRPFLDAAAAELSSATSCCAKYSARLLMITAGEKKSFYLTAQCRGFPLETAAGDIWDNVLQKGESKFQVRQHNSELRLIPYIIGRGKMSCFYWIMRLIKIQVKIQEVTSESRKD